MSLLHCESINLVDGTTYGNCQCDVVFWAIIDESHIVASESELRNYCFGSLLYIIDYFILFFNYISDNLFINALKIKNY